MGHRNPETKHRGSVSSDDAVLPDSPGVCFKKWAHNHSPPEKGKHARKKKLELALVRGEVPSSIQPDPDHGGGVFTVLVLLRMANDLRIQ